MAASSASADPCAGGGALTITASADSLTLAPTAATTFNFGEHVILTAAASGFTIMGYSWSIDGPTIKDYSETLGTQSSPPLPAATPWSTTPLSASDLTAPSVLFYWVPSAAQFEPNNGPFTRNVTLNVTQSGGGFLQRGGDLHGGAHRVRHHEASRRLLHLEPSRSDRDRIRWMGEWSTNTSTGT